MPNTNVSKKMLCSKEYSVFTWELGFFLLPQPRAKQGLDSVTPVSNILSFPQYFLFALSLGQGQTYPISFLPSFFLSQNNSTSHPMSDYYPEPQHRPRQINQTARMTRGKREREKKRSRTHTHTHSPQSRSIATNLPHTREFRDTLTVPLSFLLCDVFFLFFLSPSPGR